MKKAEFLGLLRQKLNQLPPKDVEKTMEYYNEMIDDYVARVHPTDRAGAYDIDESGDLIVASYDGSYENIMGLPVEPLYDLGVKKVNLPS